MGRLKYPLFTRGHHPNTSYKGQGVHAQIILDEASFDRFQQALDPKLFRRTVERGLRRGLKKAAAYLKKELKRSITAYGSFEANRPLTVLLKDSAIPLIGQTEELVNSVAYQKISNYEYHIGVVKMRGSYNVAEIIHDGFTITLTPKVMAKLSSLAAEAQTRYGMSVAKASRSIVMDERRRKRKHFIAMSPKGSDSSGRVIKVKPRPYMYELFNSKLHQNRVRVMLNESIIKELTLEHRKLGAKVS